MKIRTAALALVLATGLAVPASAVPGPEIVLDPATPRETVDAPVDVDATGNMAFVKNIPYPNGTDIEFGEFTVRTLDENGEPICVRDEAEECVLDDEGNVVYETEQRDYAFAGALDNTQAVRIVDITEPEQAFIASTVNCNLYQADVQVRPDLGLLVVAQDQNTNACGFGGSQGIAIFDVSDPRFPEQLSVFKSTRGTAISGAGGAHNATFHPTEPLVYISDSDIANTSLGEIPIVDVSDPREPKLVNTFRFHAHSPHDVFFNAAGTRAYTASISHSDILDTSDPRNPELISTIHDPTINIHHDTQVTPDGNTLIIGDELAGAAAGPQCPGGGLHFYDISDEEIPRKIGVFFADTQSQASLCTAHVFRINPDGKSLVIGWYNGGTRIVDISDPTGIGPHEIAHMVPSGLGGNNGVANSWASKAYKGYIYSNDRARGLDIMQLDAPEPDPGAAMGVVSLIDTGINPYHQVFRWDDPRAMQHPSTYIPGYPADAVALPISLDEPDYWTAVKKDCPSIWATVQTGKLYWFPGTKIIGGISFGNVGPINCSPAQPSGGRVLDTGGHGTMVASRAAANTYGACPTCLVVAIQNPLAVNLLNPASSNQEVIDSIRFAGNNAHWIDAQSNSWGPIAFPAWEPTGQAGLLTANPALVRAVEEVSQKHPAFWASGNGAAGRGGVIGSPTLLTPTLTPSAISVGGNDSGQVNIWPGFPPHLISDSCQAWAAQHRSTTGQSGSVAGGTSGATPFVAGGAVRILLEARRILGDERTGVREGVVAEGEAGLVEGPLADGKLTMAEWREVVFKTASSRHIREFEDGNVCPTAELYNTYPVKYGQIPKNAPAWLFVGYGAVDGPSRRLAYSVLNGERAMPVRLQEDTYFAADDQVRRATHEVYSRP